MPETALKSPIEEARAEGYSDDGINEFLRPKIEVAKRKAIPKKKFRHVWARNPKKKNHPHRCCLIDL